MLLPMICREIEFNAIDFENETFRISEEVVSAPLLASLREIGQLNPVVLLEGDGLYRIVCGFRRLYALRQIGASGVFARILEGKSTELPGVFDLALWDNLSHRNLEPLEKARVIFKLENDFGISEEMLMQVYLPRLDLAPHKQTLHAYTMLHALHPDLRGLFKTGRLTQASIECLSEMPPSSREAIVAAMQGMRLSSSLQRKFFGLLEDLAAMNDSEPGAFIKDPRVMVVLNSDPLSPGERGDRVCEILYRYRYPGVSQAGDRFMEQKKMLGLPGSVRVTAEPYFETPNLHVEFTARDAERFRKMASELFEASQKPELDLLYGIFE